MTVKTRLLASGTNEEFHWVRSSETGEPVLVTTDESRAHGLFKSATLGATGTVVIVQPPPSGRVRLTDLIVSTDKTAGSTVTLAFEDGTNTINIAVFDSANAPVSLAHTFAGKFEGWKDARVEMIVAGGNAAATITLGYIKFPEGIEFAEWDALR